MSCLEPLHQLLTGFEEFLAADFLAQFQCGGDNVLHPARQDLLRRHLASVDLRDSVRGPIHQPGFAALGAEVISHRAEEVLALEQRGHGPRFFRRHGQGLNRALEACLITSRVMNPAIYRLLDVRHQLLHFCLGRLPGLIELLTGVGCRAARRDSVAGGFIRDGLERVDVLLPRFDRLLDGLPGRPGHLCHAVSHCARPLGQSLVRFLSEEFSACTSTLRSAHGEIPGRRPGVDDVAGSSVCAGERERTRRTADERLLERLGIDLSIRVVQLPTQLARQVHRSHTSTAGSRACGRVPSELGDVRPQASRQCARSQQPLGRGGRHQRTNGRFRRT